MIIQKLAVDGFGMLSQVEISRLTPGLNVIHGTNGSGKTTILHFLRGVLCGFREARELHLLPPLKGGNPGGSVSVSWNNGIYDVIRQQRPDRSDLVAINLTRGTVSDVPALRNMINGINKARFCTIFAVSSLESHALDAMVQIALHDGIDLHTENRREDWLFQRVEHIRQERAGLFQSEPTSRGRIAELERRRGQLDQDVQKLSREHQARHERWAASVHRLTHEIERLERELSWLLAELGATQADLTEVQDRLWSTRRATVEEQHVIEHPATEQQPVWIDDLHEIDAQIAHAQQVLRDLARSRLEISMEKSRLAGTEAPEADVYFTRHREAIRSIESQAVRLQTTHADILAAQGNGQCLCPELAGTVSTVLESIRSQLYLICQELSRQQAAHEQLFLHSQRDGVDRCELELTRQIQRLRARRDEILHDRARTACETLQYRDRSESAHCNCQEHQDYVDGLPASRQVSAPAREVVTKSREVLLSNARPGDTESEPVLINKVRQLQKQYRDAQFKRRDARQQLSRLEQEQNLFADDQTLQQRRYEYVIIEQQLADAREQWQSLALLQSILQATCDMSRVDRRSPVIEEASTLLNRLTEGRYLGFNFNAETHELKVISDTGSHLSIQALSRGTLDQASLSFRLALCSEYARRGIHFPIVLDDVLADSDENRSRISTEVLSEYAQAGRQIIFLTCQDRLALQFEEMKVPVQYLTGTPRRLLPVSPASTPVSAHSAAVPANRMIDRKPVISAPHAFHQEQEARRVQPASPFWLEVNSSLSYLPSMSSQMARRLGSLGIKDIGELLDLNPGASDIPLAALQLSVSQLKTWQGEARLLCCVPDLTGRDAQLLVTAGYDQTEKLQNADIDLLLTQIAEIWQRRNGDAEYCWQLEHPGRPDREMATRWTRSARRGRTLAEARESALRRRPVELRERRRRRRENRRLEFANGRPGQRLHSIGTAVAIRPEATTSHAELATTTAESLSITAPRLRHFLEVNSDIVQAPSIGPKTAARLEKIGIRRVSDLLNGDALRIAEMLKIRHISGQTILTWQEQSRLMCQVPELRGHDAQVLVACGLRSPEQISAMSPQRLLDIVGPFSVTKEGQRLLRSASSPDLEEVTNWIAWAKQSRSI